MDLGELLSTGIILEVMLKHIFRHLFRPCAVDLDDLFVLRIVGVQAAELALAVSGRGSGDNRKGPSLQELAYVCPCQQAGGR